MVNTILYTISLFALAPLARLHLAQSVLSLVNRVFIFRKREMLLALWLWRKDEGLYFVDLKKKKKF